MPSTGDVEFGPYRLDLQGRRLLKGDLVVPIQPRPLHLLQVLVEHAGQLLTKDQLIDAVWKGTAVSDGSLTQALFTLRNILDPDQPTRYIETAARVGYRFVAPVSRVVPRQSDAELDRLLAPHRAFINGRAALETLTLAEVLRARHAFDDLVAGDADQATFHVGLATACVLQFEATRTDAAPDTDALALAVRHAHEACRLRPDYAEAWATLGFVLSRAGRGDDGVAAVHRSISLEPDNWRHYLRLADGTWGEARLRAARRTLELFPRCAMARWMAASVYVARGALQQAEQEIDLGLAYAEDDAGGRFWAVALCWLKGLLCLTRGAEEEALGWFARELELEPRGHLYGREIAANTWYAIGAIRRRQQDLAAARAAFGEALARVPRHPFAAVGLALVEAAAAGKRRGAKAPRMNGHAVAPTGMPMAFAQAQAILLVGTDDAPGAAALVGAALAEAPPGNAGWTVPIDPLLAVAAAPELWTAVLARISKRAG